MTQAHYQAEGVMYVTEAARFRCRIYSEKYSRVFQHIFEAYQGAGRSIYEEVA